MTAATVDHDMGGRFSAFSDPAIKLFGRDIPLTSRSSMEAPEDISDQDIKADMVETDECNEGMDAIPPELGAPASVNDGNEAMGSLSMKKRAQDMSVMMRTPSQSVELKAELPQGSPPASVEKTSKKPDKLIPCPRCKSLDTKFCYFNNYNVNQPRHFCRKCQRYWTAGGTLRNVPVGAGRRKHKQSISHQKHVIVSDAVPLRPTSADMAYHRCSASSLSGSTALSNPSKPMLHVLHLDMHAAPGTDSPSSTSSMLSFSQENPLCKSMAATTLSMGDCRAMQNAHERFNTNAAVSADAAACSKCSSKAEVLPGKAMTHYISGQQEAVAAGLQKEGSISCPTSVSPAIPSLVGDTPPQEAELKVKGVDDVHNTQVRGAGHNNYGGVWQLGGPNMMSNAHFYPAATNTAHGGEGGNPSLPQSNMLPCNGGPGSFWTGFPWPMMNPTMWAPPPLEWASPWNLPFCPPGMAAAAAAAATALFPFPSAGSAYEKPQQAEVSQPEKCLWVPKTLRIDDPLDAARSSIWATLGLGEGPLSSPVKGQLKAFGAKTECKENDEASTCQQHANPAASSRSAAFHESS